MNWYKIAQVELWKMPRNKYINWNKEEYDTMTPEKQDFYLREKNKKRKEWDRAIQNALSTGLTNLQEVDQLGWYGGGAPNLSYVRPLPQTLYHVTTNKNAVLKEGLKNRAELNQSMGIGLGGGDEETISFTTDLGVAQSIYRSLIEGKKVASGEISVSEMIQQASTGEGAKKPWIRDISNYYKKNPQELEEQITILEYRAKPGAYGYYVSSLGEWRTWNGNAVELVGEVEHELV